MQKKALPKNPLRIWLIVSIGINIYIIVCSIKDEGEKRTINQIKASPIDTIWYKDSAYVINSKIEKVYSDPDKNKYQSERY